MGEKIITTNIYRIQACDSIMCRQFYIGFTDFKLNNKRLADFTDYFSLDSFDEKKDKIILEYCLELEIKNLLNNIMLQLKH